MSAPASAQKAAQSVAAPETPPSSQTQASPAPASPAPASSAPAPGSSSQAASAATQPVPAQAGQTGQEEWPWTSQELLSSIWASLQRMEARLAEMEHRQ